MLRQHPDLRPEEVYSALAYFYDHQEGTSIGRLIEDIELVAKCLAPEELANAVTYLPLR